MHAYRHTHPAANVIRHGGRAHAQIHAPALCAVAALSYRSDSNLSYGSHTPRVLAFRWREAKFKPAMAVGKLAKFLLAVTAFAPVLLTYAIVSVINCDYWHAAAFAASCVLLVLLCAALLRFAKTRLQSRNYRASTVETADSEVFGLLLIYLLPLITRVEAGDGATALLTSPTRKNRNRAPPAAMSWCP